ncbi:protein of unknown function [Actinopolyspora mzabensis]|uniref:DUF4192 domain-containing protein n=1 Tax=Actinopolyspora mzabensis TaxID=995066 RepID=A0A1G9BJH6_ACTMZ|nr:DUF4192 domain-containing protein [Actinopolyspora mzabensis]SDK39617.1 protein of unknown function [Actinopolyspora mzabensis]
MGSTAKQRTVRLSAPAEYLAAIPHLLGFYPRDSLVLTTLHGGPETAKLGMTARVDLPEPNCRRELVAELVRGPVSNDGPDGLLVAVVAAPAPDAAESESASAAPVRPPENHPDLATADPPRSELVDSLRRELRTADIPLVRALWTPEIRSGGVWRCYGEQWDGTVPDPRSSPLAAELAVSGAITFSSREELAASVAPESPETPARWSARLNLMQDEAEPHRGDATMCAADTEAVFAAIRRTARGSPLTEEDLLRVLVALSDYRVRDLAMGIALTVWSRAAEQLWFVLVRKAPEPEVADVAALLAFSAYLRGDGALASVALDRVERTRPAHRLGELLRRALDSGIGPEELAVVVRDTAVDARLMIEQEET